MTVIRNTSLVFALAAALTVSTNLRAAEAVPAAPVAAPEQARPGPMPGMGPGMGMGGERCRMHQGGMMGDGMPCMMGQHKGCTMGGGDAMTDKRLDMLEKRMDMMQMMLETMMKRSAGSKW